MLILIAKTSAFCYTFSLSRFLPSRMLFLLSIYLSTKWRASVRSRDALRRDFLPTPTPASLRKIEISVQIERDKRTNPLISARRLPKKTSSLTDENNRNWHPTNTLARFSLPLDSPIVSTLDAPPQPKFRVHFFVVLQLVLLELDARERDRIESSTTSPQKQSKKCTFPLFRSSKPSSAREVIYSHCEKIFLLILRAEFWNSKKKKYGNKKCKCRQFSI